eukprot:m.240713 g.240713  ORF g.240713 m.240713 type:complete len:1287 (-) comp15849_c0_seq1:35-3895(-)
MMYTHLTVLVFFCLSVLFLVNTGKGVGAETICHVCACNGATVVCDSKEFETLPPPGPFTTKMVIKDNKMLRLHPDDFIPYSAQLQELIIEFCEGITALTADFFANLSILRVLDLKLNTVAYLDENAFRGLKGLKKLVIVEFAITKFPPIIFDALDSLEDLEVAYQYPDDGNPISVGNVRLKEVPAGLFDKVADTLKILRFQVLLDVVKFPPALFWECKNLVTLAVGGNLQLEYFDPYFARGLTRLADLNFAFNFLKTLPVFDDPLPNIGFVSYDANAIQRIPWSFRHLTFSNADDIRFVGYGSQSQCRVSTTTPFQCTCFEGYTGDGTFCDRPCGALGQNSADFVFIKEGQVASAVCNDEDLIHYDGQLFPGSKCNIVCPNNTVVVGPTYIECTEPFTWAVGSKCVDKDSYLCDFEECVYDAASQHLTITITQPIEHPALPFHIDQNELTSLTMIMRTTGSPPQTTFIGLEHLHTLKLVDLGVKRVDDGLFTPLPELNTLILENTPASSALLQTLSGVEELVFLYRLELINIPFAGLHQLETRGLQYLTELVVTKASWPASFLNTTFDNFLALRSIHLEEVGLSALPDYLFPEHQLLSYLAIIKNPLPIVSISSFSKMRRLQDLVMDTTLGSACIITNGEFKGCICKGDDFSLQQGDGCYRTCGHKLQTFSVSREECAAVPGSVCEPLCTPAYADLDNITSIEMSSSSSSHSYVPSTVVSVNRTISCTDSFLWDENPCVSALSTCGVNVLNIEYAIVNPTCTEDSYPFPMCSFACESNLNELYIAACFHGQWRFARGVDVNEPWALTISSCLKSTSNSSSRGGLQLSNGVVAGIVVLVAIVVLLVVLLVMSRNSSKRKLIQSQLDEVEQHNFMLENEIARGNVFLEKLKRKNAGLFKVIPKNDLRMDSVLGSGAFGVVHLAHLRVKKGRELDVAVKKLAPGIIDPRDKAAFIAEIKLMALLSEEKHSSLVKMYGMCVANDTPMIVMEYLPNGNLRDHLRDLKHHEDAVAWAEILQCALAVSRGIEFLLSQGVIHRDLACRNVLVGVDLRETKISDYGMARYLSESDYYRKASNAKLPVRWMAPESIEDRIWTLKSDVWSFGIVMWEMCNMGQTPYPKLSSSEILRNVRNAEKHLPMSFDCPQGMVDVMVSCWKTDEGKRPAMGEVAKRLAELSEEDVIEGNVTMTSSLKKWKESLRTATTSSHPYNTEVSVGSDSVLLVSNVHSAVEQNSNEYKTMGEDEASVNGVKDMFTDNSAFHLDEVQDVESIGKSLDDDNVENSDEEESYL